MHFRLNTQKCLTCGITSQGQDGLATFLRPKPALTWTVFHAFKTRWQEMNKEKGIDSTSTPTVAN